MVELPVLQGCSTLQIGKRFGNTLIDAEDWPLLSQRRWDYRITHGSPYIIHVKWTKRVGTGRKKCRTQLHRELVDAPKGMEVDHVNRDTLDNRKCNLRVATKSQNCCNMKKTTRPGTTSKYKGVHKESRAGGRIVWAARIKRGGKSVSLGYFDVEIDAAKAYDAAAAKEHGEFALTNAMLYGEMVA